MNKIVVLTNNTPKLRNSVLIAPKGEEKAQNAKSVDLMLFWNDIPYFINDYKQYYDILNMIYLNYNFIKCDTNGRKKQETRK